MNEWWELHLSRIEANHPHSLAACLVSSHVCLHLSVQYIRSITSHELFPAPAGGVRRVSACVSCRDLSVAGTRQGLRTADLDPLSFSSALRVRQLCHS